MTPASLAGHWDVASFDLQASEACFPIPSSSHRIYGCISDVADKEVQLDYSYMNLKPLTIGSATSSREYFECMYWSGPTSRTLDIAAKWRIIFAVRGRARQYNIDRMFQHE